MIRTVNQSAGPVARADRVPGEFVTYSTRSWRSDLTRGVLVAEDRLDSSVQLIGTVGAPETCTTVGAPWTEVFTERSVAATAWELSIPAEVIRDIDDIELRICHRFVDRL